MSIKGTDETVNAQFAMEKAEDYITTIKALLAFISLVTWDTKNEEIAPGARFSLGRRMDTSASNRVHPLTTVTPDAVIQRSESLGYVVEVKKSLPQNNNNWEDVVLQLQEYDDDLIGWWTKTDKIPEACVVLLIGISRAADFRNYVKTLIGSGKATFRNPISIVEFVRKPEVKEFLFLRLQWGSIADDQLLNILDRGKDIPIERVIANPLYGEKKFYDAPPLVEYTMVELWQHLFTDLKQSVTYDEKTKSWPIEVDISWLTSELQRLYGSVSAGERDVTFPRNEWVRDAMDAFVCLDLASKDINNDCYTVYFKLLKVDNIIEYFVRWRLHTGKNKDNDIATQLPLMQ